MRFFDDVRLDPGKLFRRTSAYNRAFCPPCDVVAPRGLVLFDPMEHRMHLYQQMPTWAAIVVTLGILGIFLLELFAVLAWA
jgi:hypothetical protein